MTDYKLVPVEPTSGMVEAAQDAYMPFGDMDIALRMAILAAPAVQREPVATIHVDGSFVHVAWRIPAPSRCAMDVYTAPQPAPDVAGLVGALERIVAWSDGGNRYGQANIKVFAAEALAAYRERAYSGRRRA